MPSERDFGYFVKIVSFLKEGGVVALPTDTVYGLVGDARNPETIEKTFVLKSRSRERPFPVFVSSYEMLGEVAYVKEERVKNFLQKAWPGKMTCIFPSRGWMPLELRARSLSIGVRIPNHPFLFRLLEAFGGPLIAASANLSGRGPYSKIEDVVSEFKKMPCQPDLVIDGGDLIESQSSTVIDLTAWPPKILREGAVGRDEIFSYLDIKND